jgi:hypothetical protein
MVALSKQISGIEDADMVAIPQSTHEIKGLTAQTAMLRGSSDSRSDVLDTADAESYCSYRRMNIHITGN